MLQQKKRLLFQFAKIDNCIGFYPLLQGIIINKFALIFFSGWLLTTYSEKKFFWEKIRINLTCFIHIVTKYAIKILQIRYLEVSYSSYQVSVKSQCQ